MDTGNHVELCTLYGARNYHPLPVVIARGRGVWVWDVEGNKYLDCLAGYSAVNQGHCHPRIMQVAMEQLQNLTLVPRCFLHDQIGPFFEELAVLCGPGKKVLPASGGAEAVETAIKMARKWGYKKKKITEGEAEIIVFENNFHGRTTTIVGFSSVPQYRDGFGPFAKGFRTVPYGDIDAVRDVITPDTAAVLVEPIQGEGGIIVPPNGYLKSLRELCSRKNVLMIVDEIQTGLGRTGKMFCSDYENVSPDAYILGKALGGGYAPVSAVVAESSVMEVFEPGDHGSTFGGNPYACAVAREALRVIVEEKLAERAAENGAYFMKRLKEIDAPYIREVRGKGLLIGVELIPEAIFPARKFCEALLHAGILCKETHDSVIRFAPPLVITREEIDWAIPRIADVLTMSSFAK